MARVTVEDCVTRVPNRFDLVMVAARRGRDIAAGAPLTVERDNDKNPVVALREIADGTVDVDELREAIIRSVQKHVEMEVPEEELLELSVVTETPSDATDEAAKPEAEAKPEAKAETKPKAKPEAEPKAEVKAKPEAETEPEAKAETEPEAEAKPEVEAKAEVEAKVETEAEPEAEEKREDSDSEDH